MGPQDSKRKVQCMRSRECCKIGHVWQFYKIHWWVRCCSLLCARYYPKVALIKINSSRKTAYLKQSKASKFVIECKFKRNSNKFRDQMETLHSLGEVLPLLRHRGVCRCLWHRVRLSKSWRHTPPIFLVPAFHLRSEAGRNIRLLQCNFRYFYLTYF